jgi:hypothetical protein
MTDRVSGYIVVLDTELRADDAEATLTALRQVRGVAVVTPITNEALAIAIAKGRLRVEVYHNLIALAEATLT